MAETVDLTFEGGSLGIEVSPTEAVSRDFGDQVHRAVATFDDALAGLRGFGNSLHTTLAGMISPPDAVTVEFGLSIKATGTLFVTAAEGNANFRVVMEWKKS